MPCASCPYIAEVFCPYFIYLSNWNMLGEINASIFISLGWPRFQKNDMPYMHPLLAHEKEASDALCLHKLIA